MDTAHRRGCTCHPSDRPDGPCQRRFAVSDCRSAAAISQAAELRVLANLTNQRRRLSCWLGLHQFATFQALIFTSRAVCVRCGAVYLSTGFDGITLDAPRSRAELLSCASEIEARNQPASDPTHD